jgi:hypothetical protein
VSPTEREGRDVIGHEKFRRLEERRVTTLTRWRRSTPWRRGGATISVRRPVCSEPPMDGPGTFDGQTPAYSGHTRGLAEFKKRP